MAHRLQMSTDEFVSMVTSWLHRAIADNDIDGDRNVHDITYFHGCSPPKIKIQEYLHRLLQYTQHQNEVLVGALVYLRRVYQKHPKIGFVPETIHRLILTSFVVSAKMHEDYNMKLGHYAKIGGVSIFELKRLELCLLHLLDFRLFVTIESYNNTIALLTKTMSITV